ncbi:MAG: zinc-ribbon domain-containing protein [Alphaproteobacteria bacterium]
MILTCPNCEKSFSLPAQALAPEGKRVKCSACDSQWFQMPDADELIAELEESVAQDGVLEAEAEVEAARPVEDIPEAVKPRAEGTVKAKTPSKEKKPMGVKAVVALAAGIVVLAVMPIFVFKGALMAAWPKSIGFYSAVGVVDGAAHEGLIFDQIRAEREGEKVIITGQVINLTAKDAVLPMIAIALEGAEHEVLAKWYVDAPQASLEAEGVLPFQSEYVFADGGDVAAKDVKDIVVRFSLVKADDAVKAAKSSPESHHQKEDHHSSDGHGSH